MIRMQTSMGTIEIELDHEKAPATSENFEQYVKEGFYDGTIFHRVIDNFMIQGGGLTPDMETKSTRAPVKNEADNGLDFKSPNVNGWGYCVFGKVVNGMDVVNKIKAQPTTGKMGHQDVPVDDIIIEKVEIVEG
jgi:peptidyl-prolyl cis-trans isomerase B (cyclophilin B)